MNPVTDYLTSFVRGLAVTTVSTGLMSMVVWLAVHFTSRGKLRWKVVPKEHRWKLLLAPVLVTLGAASLAGWLSSMLGNIEGLQPLRMSVQSTAPSAVCPVLQTQVMWRNWTDDSACSPTPTATPSPLSTLVPTIAPSPTPPPPEIDYFRAEDSAKVHYRKTNHREDGRERVYDIEAGSDVELTWSVVGGVKEVTLSGFGPQPFHGARTIPGAENIVSRTYQLSATAKNAFFPSIYAFVRLEVTPPPPPPPPPPAPPPEPPFPCFEDFYFREQEPDERAGKLGNVHLVLVLKPRMCERHRGYTVDRLETGGDWEAILWSGREDKPWIQIEWEGGPNPDWLREEWRGQECPKDDVEIMVDVLLGQGPHRIKPTFLKGDLANTWDPELLGCLYQVDAK